MARRTRTASLADDSELDDFDDFEEESGSSRKAGTKELIRGLLGRWHWIALGLVLGLLGSFYYLSKAPRIYQATSSLLIKQAATTVVAGGQPDEPIDLGSKEAVNTVAERVKRPELLKRVALHPEVQAAEGLIPPQTNWFPAWARGWLGKNQEAPVSAKALDPMVLGQMIGAWTSVGVRSGTRLLDITVAHPSPEIASLLANIIAREYPNELGTTRAEGRNSSSKMLALQVEEAEKILLRKQNALANYKIILESLRKLEEKEATFSDRDRRYTSKHPKWKTAKQTVDQFRDRFLAEFEQVRQASADKDYWEENREEWDREGLDENTRLQAARRLLAAREDVLQSGIVSQNEMFNTLSKEKLTNDINKRSTEVEVELNTLSQLPKYPSSPKRTSTLLGGVVAGMMGGLALAFLLVRLDDKIHTVLQAEILTDLPVLATIRRIEPKELGKILAEKGISDDRTDSPTASWDPRLVFRPGLTDTVYAEMFRILRASVTLLGNERKRKTTLFSSALPGEGKTLTSANFAIASAQQGKKTLLLDLDLRKPAIHKIFGHKRGELGAGSTEILAGQASWREALVPMAGQENLSCLFAGQKAPNPGELLRSDSIARLLGELEEEFEVIVIDSAPLLSVPDTRLLIPEVDNFCLVIRAEETPRNAIRKALEVLADDGTEPAGVVINGYEENARRLGRKYRYGYGQYGKGYGYGTYGSDDDDD